MPPDSTARPPIAVFDLDGTLAETAGDLIGTLNVLMKREGLAELPLSQARGLIGAGAKALIRRGFEAEGRALSPEDHERLFEAFIAHYGKHLADTSHLYPGVVEALDALEAAGFRLAVCTNKFEGQSVERCACSGSATASRRSAGATPSRPTSPIRATSPARSSAPGATRPGPSWSAIRAPTSTPPRPPASRWWR